MIAVISHIAFFVSDLQRSTLFYRDVLHLPQMDEPFGLGLHSWFSLGSHCQLHLIARAGSLPPFHINHHLALRTDSFSFIIEKLTQHNIVYYDAQKIQGKIQVRPDGIQQVFFQDPDGYWIELNNEPLP